MNYIFGKARAAWARGEIDWINDDIRVDLVDTTGLTIDRDVTEFRSEIPVAARTASFGPLVGKTCDLGVLDCDDHTFPAVTGATSEALIYWRNTGVDTTSRLLAFVDDAPGLPILPNGSGLRIEQPPTGVAVL